jgi:phosphate transport system substrate-binding protein
MKHAYLFIIPIVIAGIIGCNKKTEIAVPDRSMVLTADPYLPLMRQEVEQYMSLYPQVTMEASSASTREAIVHMLNDSVHSIVIDRQLNDEERQVAQQASIKIVENRIAEDGIAVIVHTQNPVKNITVEAVKNIVSSTVKNWDEVPNAKWTGAIDMVMTGRNSGMYELIHKKIFSIQKTLEPTTIAGDQLEVIRYVSMHPHAVGFVAASLVTGGRKNIKVVPVAAKDPDGTEKEYFPGQMEIYSSLYPLHYSLYLYNTESKAPAGVGFSALVLSNVGQKIVQKAGLVPAFIPYRTIQLHAE